MLPFLAFAMMAGGSVDAAACSGTTTIAVDACLAARFEAADVDLNRYYGVALRRVRKDDGKAVADGLVRAQRSWLAYRTSECGAVFDRFAGGTIRTSVATACRIRLTRLRTYAIWRDWLTYPDSTPASLPRPAVEDALSDGRG